MIKSIQIKNFKSVVDLQLDLGSFNVLIGENGCGKSNILEAVAFGAAASANKLDFEFLGSRGIRLTNPEFMFSAFDNGTKEKLIDIGNLEDDSQNSFEIKFGDNSWIVHRKDEIAKGFEKVAQQLIQATFTESLELKDELLSSLVSFERFDDIRLLINLIKNKKSNEENSEIINKIIDVIIKITTKFSNTKFSNFIIFSLEESKLRRYEDTNQIYPLGIKGEGLFQYLKELMRDEKNKEIIEEIKENLALLDWYEDFILPNNTMQNEYGLSIKDRYLHQNLQFFDQRSTNEGFLYLLFYTTLFISKDTPQFFAIDNIDASFNPKLCMELTRNLAALAKKHNKQVIVTTHNPAILDGLNLKDDDQRLFVVRRNDEGHTKAKRVEFKAERTMKLSEVWTNGFIGGLPENF